MFEEHFYKLCEAIGTDYNIGRVADHCVPLISNRTYDITMITANPAYDRARALVKELHDKLKASKDQQQYLLKLIAIFQKFRDDERLTEIAESMKSEL